jgi:hypothetical protein
MKVNTGAAVDKPAGDPLIERKGPTGGRDSWLPNPGSSSASHVHGVHSLGHDSNDDSLIARLIVRA